MWYNKRCNNKKMTTNLKNKTCVSCEGHEKPLEKDEIAMFRRELDVHWDVVADSKIRHEFKFSNFKKAIAFVNKVAEIAEREGHHPDIYVFGYSNVIIELWTHAIGGLSENDFIVAAKIEGLHDSDSSLKGR